MSKKMQKEMLRGPRDSAQKQGEGSTAAKHRPISIHSQRGRHICSQTMQPWAAHLPQAESDLRAPGGREQLLPTLVLRDAGTRCMQ